MGERLQEIYTRLAGEGRLTSDPAQLAVLPELERIRTALETAQPRKRIGGLFARKAEPVEGLYLWGGVGRGKSMLMDLFFASVEIEAKRRVHFHAFMQEIQAALHAARKTGVDDAILPVAKGVIDEVRLLCFDEMHKNGLNRQLFVPFIDLLQDSMVVWELTSPTDYRQDRLAGEKVYFTPHDASARDAVSDIWSDLTGGGCEPLVLHVNGRDVEADPRGYPAALKRKLQ